MGRTFENRKHDMAKTQGAKIKVYSKYGKEIYVCAKQGQPDPDLNAALRRLIERAKKDQVPTHVIDKAIEKAKGTGGEDYSPARYEGYGPNGSMVIVDCLTDNPNRTFSDVRVCFNKANSKLGGPGAVAHMFDHVSLFVFKGESEDEILEALMMADVDVTEVEKEGEMITVIAPHTEFYNVKTALAEAYPELTFEMEEITFEPQTTTVISGDDVASFDKLITTLNDCEDVQEVYHNAEIER